MFITDQVVGKRLCTYLYQMAGAEVGHVLFTQDGTFKTCSGNLDGIFKCWLNHLAFTDPSSSTNPLSTPKQTSSTPSLWVCAPHDCSGPTHFHCNVYTLVGLYSKCYHLFMRDQCKIIISLLQQSCMWSWCQRSVPLTWSLDTEGHFFSGHQFQIKVLLEHDSVYEGTKDVFAFAGLHHYLAETFGALIWRIQNEEDISPSDNVEKLILNKFIFIGHLSLITTN